MARLNGSNWTGKYSSGGTNYTRTLRAYAEYTTSQTPTTFTINISAVGIEKTSGGATEFINGQVKRAYIQIKDGSTVLSTIGNTSLSTSIKFSSSNPYAISFGSGSYTIEKGSSAKTITLYLYGQKVDKAWAGSSSGTFTITVPAVDKPSVRLSAVRNNDETSADITASVTSFVGDTITDFKLTTFGKTITFTDGVIGESGEITKKTTVTGIALGSVSFTLVATGIGGTSSPVSRALPSAFYTLDIGAEGKEISFGASSSGDSPPENGLFKCQMDAAFLGKTSFAKGVKIPWAQHMWSGITGTQSTSGSMQGPSAFSGHVWSHQTNAEDCYEGDPNGFIVKKSGTYLLQAYCHYNTGSNSTQMMVAFKNYTRNKEIGQRMYSVNAITWGRLSYSIIEHIEANDTVIVTFGKYSSGTGTWRPSTGTFDIVLLEEDDSSFEPPSGGGGDTPVDPSAPNDYVVGHGTDGIFTYRKWNSGIMEAWGTAKLAAGYTWKGWGNCYETSSGATVTYPSQFIGKPWVSASCTASDGSIGTLSAEIYKYYDESASLYATRPNTAATPELSFFIELKGRWK